MGAVFLRLRLVLRVLLSSRIKYNPLNLLQDCSGVSRAVGALKKEKNAAVNKVIVMVNISRKNVEGCFNVRTVSRIVSFHVHRKNLSYFKRYVKVIPLESYPSLFIFSLDP